VSLSALDALNAPQKGPPLSSLFTFLLCFQGWSSQASQDLLAVEFPLHCASSLSLSEKNPLGLAPVNGAYVTAFCSPWACARSLQACDKYEKAVQLNWDSPQVTLGIH